MFDICYDYDIYKIFRNYLSGKCPLSAYTERVNLQESIYPANYVKLRYLENHDQDRAASFITTKEALENWTAFVYFQKGMTLIYNGQETADANLPDLFNKDIVNWKTGLDLSLYMKKLYKIKKNPILTNSTYSIKAYDEEDIAVAVHETKEGKLTGIFSFKGNTAEVKVDLEDGNYVNLIDGEMIKVEAEKVYCIGKPIIIESK